MIYLDSSVVLAELFTEDRRPPAALWDESLVSSRLVEYEVWNRFHARGLLSERESSVRLLLSQITMYELNPDHLGRALRPFPISVRTLDALHLATMDYLRTQGREIALATYDHRLLAAAQTLGIETAPL